MKARVLCALALVFAMVCVTTSAWSQPLPDEDDLPEAPVVNCDDPGQYREPGSAPEPADPLTTAACRAKGKIVEGGPTPQPAPFEEEGEHPSPASDQGGGSTGDEGAEPGDAEEGDTPAPTRPWTSANGAMSGIQTADGFSGQYGIYAALTVTNARVPRNSSQYLSQRVLAKSCDRGDWFEIGWVEAGWRDDKQYIYTHDTPSSGWTFYDQYPLTPGQRIYVQVTQVPSNANLWQVYLWWNGSWHLLRETVNTDWLGCGGELMVDRYQTGQGTWFNTNGAVNFGDGTSSGVMVKNVGTNSWQPWDRSFPTAVYSGDYYCWDLKTIFNVEWYWGYTHSNNCAPNTTLSVTPTSGTRVTDFQAKLSGTIDWNGDPMNSFRIDWGDGSSSYPSGTQDVMTHRYASAGSYQVRGYACDDLGSCAYSPAQSVHVDTTNTAPVINFNVSPTSGDRTTTFNANFNGTYDPENDSINYRIDWGDGTVNNSQSASHRYQNAGTYTVTGRACDGFGACSTSSRTVTVAFSNRRPSANLTVNPKEGDLQTIFHANVSGSDPDGDAVSYQIDWGDGTVTHGAQADHTYSASGNYEIRATVRDQHGLYSTDEGTVRVCEVRPQGACVQAGATVDQTVEGCFESGTCPEDPLGQVVPDEVANLVGPLLQQVEKPKLTPKNRVLVVDANVMQAYAETGDPDYKDDCSAPGATQTCDAPGREERFSQRLLALSQKSFTETGDGIGGRAADVILLQESRFQDADSIAEYLTRAFGRPYEVARAKRSPPVNDLKAEREWCARHEQGMTTADCTAAITIKNDTAIVYNTRGVQPLPDGAVVDSKYSPRESCEINIDTDLDGDNDCAAAKWKRHYLQGFVEVDPSGERTKYQVAVASVHFVTKSHFQLNTTYDSRAKEWVNALANAMASAPLFGPRYDAFVIGGDINNHRCSTKRNPDDPLAETDPAFRGDHPFGVPCDPEEEWFTTLTGARGYTDTILSEHSDEETGDRLVPQYRDGSGWRTKRIDYIFSRLADIEFSSYDITCGQPGAVATWRMRSGTPTTACCGRFSSHEVVRKARSTTARGRRSRRGPRARGRARGCVGEDPRRNLG